jgi:hypothetical protein
MTFQRGIMRGIGFSCSALTSDASGTICLPPDRLRDAGFRNAARTFLGKSLRDPGDAPQTFYTIATETDARELAKQLLTPRCYKILRNT